MPEWLFPVSPVAASRPRVSRHGAYYTGPYKYFRQEMAEVVPLILGESFIPLTGSLKVEVEIFIKQPKKTRLVAPKADIDNFVKAVFDCLNDRLWEDDKQVIQLYAVKQWTKRDGYFTVGVDELPP